jgi:hypothetical protein
MMTFLMAFVFGWDTQIPDVIKDWAALDPGILISVGTLLLVSAAAFVWAAFFRKPRRRSHYHFHHGKTETAPVPIPGKGLFSMLSFRKRHRHRERPRNPTLAEAGGLPPIRPEGPPPPPL